MQKMKKAIITSLLFVGLMLAGSFQTLAQAKSIAGEWDAAMSTPGGVRNFKIVFTVDGEKLTGTVKRAAGDVPLTGTIKGKDVAFTYVVRYGENDLMISMTGTLDGDDIAGTVSFGESGQQDQWSAKRVAVTKPPTR
jgi:hypothetical protein